MGRSFTQFRGVAISPNWITSNAELGEAAAGWGKVLGLDTEFQRTSTFFPLPGLYQIVSDGEVYLIDPLTIDDWHPLVEALEDAAPLVDAIAPEHLEIATDQPEDFLARINNAGAVFLGRFTPEAIGDYVAGPNHVLPTSRTARFSSGLSVLDYMKRTTILSCDAGALNALGPPALALADAEGLTAHGKSISIRLNRKS